MTAPGEPRIRGAVAAKPPVHRVFIAQGVLLAVAAAVVALAGLPKVAVSLVLGGILHLLPSMYFARQVFRFSGARAAQRIAQSFYRGELGKFVLTASGFALVFLVVDGLNPPALFAGYGVMLVCHAMGVAWLSR